MLVLTRKLDESIIIDDVIEIKVLEVKENTVKLGIVAPREIQILRKEIFEEIKKANILAASTSPDRLPDLKKQLPKKK